MLEIEGRNIGAGHPCLIIAEAGVNHNGDVNLAREMVRVAANARADAVKFQTFKAEKLTTAGAPKAAYQTLTTGKGESQLKMLKKLELAADDFQVLIEDCRKNKILFLSTPFDD